jgi:hypothetical protein
MDDAKKGVHREMHIAMSQNMWARKWMPTCVLIVRPSRFPAPVFLGQKLASEASLG